MQKSRKLERQVFKDLKAHSDKYLICEEAVTYSKREAHCLVLRLNRDDYEDDNGNPTSVWEKRAILSLGL